MVGLRQIIWTMTGVTGVTLAGYEAARYTGLTRGTYNGFTAAEIERIVNRLVLPNIEFSREDLKRNGSVRRGRFLLGGDLWYYAWYQNDNGKKAKLRLYKPDGSDGFMISTRPDVFRRTDRKFLPPGVEV